VEIPIPSVPLIGLNNWKVAVMAGDYASTRIKSRWGSSQAIDLVLLMQMPVYGDLNMLRTEGFADALIDEFGDDIQSKIVRADCGMGKIEEAEKAMSRILEDHPQARRMVITAINEELVQGVINSLKGMNRWNREELVLVTYGCDTLGQEQLRHGLIDATVASFPEHYGEYVIPAVCSLLAQEPVPGYTYVRNEFITKDNIDEYYP
jgi:ribose transport system substrate-binding protein